MCQVFLDKKDRLALRLRHGTVGKRWDRSAVDGISEFLIARLKKHSFLTVLSVLQFYLDLNKEHVSWNLKKEAQKILK